MQPTPLIAIQSRLDLPDPGRCTECKLSAKESSRRERGKRARARLRRR